MADAMKNNAWATVKTAPTPAISGTSIVVNSGQGAKLPTVPFNAKVVPAGTMNPYMSDSEIIRVTGISTDTLTVSRSQESSSAISIAVGDIIMAMPTKKIFDDIATMFSGAKGYVNHGSNAAMARPTGYASIEWSGTVEPINMTNVDTWILA